MCSYLFTLNEEKGIFQFSTKTPTSTTYAIAVSGWLFAASFSVRPWCVPPAVWRCACASSRVPCSASRPRWPVPSAFLSAGRSLVSGRESDFWNPDSPSLPASRAQSRNLQSFRMQIHLCLTFLQLIVKLFFIQL